MSDVTGISSSADVECGGKRPTKKKRSSSKGKGKGAGAKPDTPLSEEHRGLLDLFAAVDHAYCFLVKNSIPPRIASLQSMVWRLFPGRFGEPASFLPRLRRLAEIARAVLVLEEPPARGVDDMVDPQDDEGDQTEARRLELRFPQTKTAGTGKASVSKRQQLVRKALLEHTAAVVVGRRGNGGRSGAIGNGRVVDGLATTPASIEDKNENVNGSDNDETKTATATTAAKLDSPPGEESRPPASSGHGGSAGSAAAAAAATTAESSSNSNRRMSARRNTDDRGGGDKRKDRGASPGTASTRASGKRAGESLLLLVGASGDNNRSRGSDGALPAAETGGRRRPPATGVALSRSDPLSDSPAYVALFGEAKQGGSGSGGGGGGGEDSRVRVRAAGRTGGVGSSGNARGGVGVVGVARLKKKEEEEEEEEEEEGKPLRLPQGGVDGHASTGLRFDPLLALEYLQSLPMYEGQVAYSETLPGREGEFADTAAPLHPAVVAALARSKGVTRLFKHQAEAIDAAVAGQHVALSTATSSGKSVVFNVSVLEAIVGDRPDAVALYLFPTKALAQDQLRSLRDLVCASTYLRERVRPMTLDGDTPFGERGVVMEEANIILTNPDMLHASVLPGHKRFRRVLANLSHVVIDEAHVYRGAFGAHVSMVLRRLLRLWAVNAPPGAPPPPQFICCSATMRSAPSHFASLLPLEKCLGGRRKLYFGSADTAPTGRKTVVLWRPPIITEWFKPPQEVRRSNQQQQQQQKEEEEKEDKKKKRLPGTERNRKEGKAATAMVVEVGEQRGMRKRGSGGGSGDGNFIAPPRPLHGVEKWRREPTDNYYNKEYLRLMGAKLPSPPPRKNERAANPSPAEGGSGWGAGAGAPKGQRQGRRGTDGGGKVSSPAAAASDGSSGAREDVPGSVGDGGNAVAGAAGAVVRRSDRGKGRSHGGGGSGVTMLQDADIGLTAVGGSLRGGGVGVGVGCAASSPAALLEATGMEGVTEAVTLAAATKESGSGGFTTAAAVVATDLDKGKTAVGGREGGDEAEGAEEEEVGQGWEDGKRRSPICETAQILTALVKQRVRTLAFCRTRKLTELTLRYGQQDLEKTAPHLTSLVQGYRGGYTKDERRKIEGRLFANKLLGVTATCALELGVDIGELDVTLHLGFPGSVSSLRQQAGRAGRGGTDSLAIMVLFQDPISQFFVRSPSELLHKEPEAAVLDSTNELVLRAHLLCAAAECPLGLPALGDVTDAALFGGKEALRGAIESLMEGDFPRLVKAAENLGWKANPGLDPPPCRRVGLRMIDPVTFSVVDDLKDGEPFDSVEYSRAFFTLFEGAIYLHQARQYLVTRLDLGRHVAHTIPVKVNYYTAARNDVAVNVTKRLEASEDNHAHTGCVDVVSTVYGFVKKQTGTGRTIERRECSLPPLQYATRAFWLDVGATARQGVEQSGHDFEGGVHAVGHALLAVVPLFLLCDRADVDCEHARPYNSRPQPHRILVFDKRPGGVGVSDAMFGCHRGVLSKALDLVEGCPCPEGCLACIHDHGCTGYNAIIDKCAAVIILKSLIRDMMVTEVGGVAGDEAALFSSQRQQPEQQPAKHSAPQKGETPEQHQQQRQRLDQSGAAATMDSNSNNNNEGGFFLGGGSFGNDPDPYVGGGSSAGGREGGGRAERGIDEVENGDSDGISGSVGGGEARGGVDDDALIASPRKKRRLRNMRLAKGMDRAREKDIAVVGCWIPSVP